nr:hypothetical protein Iba_chr06bCG12650 [Ipomoea batatas]
MASAPENSNTWKSASNSAPCMMKGTARHVPSLCNSGVGSTGRSAGEWLVSVLNGLQVVGLGFRGLESRSFSSTNFAKAIASDKVVGLRIDSSFCIAGWFIANGPARSGVVGTGGVEWPGFVQPMLGVTLLWFVDGFHVFAGLGLPVIDFEFVRHREP